MSVNGKPIPPFKHERFLGKIRVMSNECWTLTNKPHHSGYIYFTIGSKDYSSHRVSYSLFKGAISDGLVIDHKCRNKACCNPDHLRMVTQKINMVAFGLDTTHCSKGHPYSGNNLVMRSGNNSTIKRRRCRECEKAKQRKKYKTKRLKEGLCYQPRK